MANENDLTILLTLKDRTPFTWRWMRYVNEIRCPFKVLIADGGADESVPGILADRRRYPKVRYDYIRYPFDRSYEDWYAKVSDALARVDTPYVVMVDNDDFFIPDGLRDCVEFLESHSDYSACGGAPIYFEVVSSNEDQNVVHGEARKFRCGYPSHSVEQETAQERVRSYMRPWAPTWYHVRRTSQLRSVWAIASELHLAELFWHERLLECLIVAEGKLVTRILFPYYFRQDNSPVSVGKSYYSASGDMFQRMFRETWLKDFNNSVQVVATAVARRDGISETQALAPIREVFMAAVARELRYAPTLEFLSHRKAPERRRIMGRTVDLMRQGRDWFYSRRLDRSPAQENQFWTTHPALVPMLAVLNNPETLHAAL